MGRQARSTSVLSLSPRVSMYSFGSHSCISERAEGYSLDVSCTAQMLVLVYIEVVEQIHKCSSADASKSIIDYFTISFVVSKVSLFDWLKIMWQLQSAHSNIKIQNSKALSKLKPWFTSPSMEQAVDRRTGQESKYLQCIAICKWLESPIHVYDLYGCRPERADLLSSWGLRPRYKTRVYDKNSPICKLLGHWTLHMVAFPLPACPIGK